MARTALNAALIAGSLLLAGCTATTPPPGGASAPATACKAEAAQVKIGQTATADLGAELLRLTGARVLRWVAPGMAVTMDFRPDRLTVAYDEKSVVTRISCG